MIPSSVEMLKMSLRNLIMVRQLLVSFWRFRAKMDNNDQIMRRAVLKLEFRPSECYMDEDGKVYVSWESLIKEVSTIPAVPHEMTAREYLYHRNRICHARYVERQDDDEFLCEKCVLKEVCAPSNEAAEISKSIAIIEQWAKEHPEKKRKTYAEDFNEKFPKALWCEMEARPVVCKEELYDDKGKYEGDCFACWNEEMEANDER